MKHKSLFLLGLMLVVVSFVIVIIGYQIGKSGTSTVVEGTQFTLKKTKLKLGIATWAGFGSGLVAMEKGFFPTIDLKTITLDDARARQAAFVAGDIDIMISSIDLYAQEAVKGIPGKVFLITDESEGGDGIVAKAEIRTLEDLRGRTVAYAYGGPSDYFLFKALDGAGVKLDEVRRIAVDDPSRAGETFLSGDVDAAVTWEPFLSNAADAGKGHILATTKDLPEIIVDILVANEELAGNHELLREFMDGWLRAVDFIKAEPEEAAAIMAKELNISLDDVTGMMAGLRFADRQRNRYFLGAASVEDARAGKLLDDAGEYWKAIGVIKEPIRGALRISPAACEYFRSE